MSDERYQEILRKMQEQQQKATQQATLTPLADVLNHLDTWSALEKAKSSVPPQMYAFGPKTVKQRKTERASIGAVIWIKQGGFYGYKLLTIVGVWAQQHKTDIKLIIGRKTLNYSAITYNPESYHKIIKKDYGTYYTDDKHLPIDNTVINYQPDKRLSLRKQLLDILLLQISAPH